MVLSTALAQKCEGGGGGGGGETRRKLFSLCFEAVRRVPLTGGRGDEACIVVAC